MLRRVLVRCAIAIGFMVAAAQAIPAQGEATAGVCFTGCLYDSCGPEQIQRECSAACESSTGGLCGEHPMCFNSVYLVCAGEVS